MKKKFLLLLPAVIVLAGCPRTNDLYERNAYNKGFMQDYYTDFAGLDQLHYDSVDVGGVTVQPYSGRAFSTKMADTDDFYRHGVLSKLYDGQTDCKEKHQLARVQINNDGFGARLAKPTDISNLEISIRGGTTHKTPLETYFDYNLRISFFTLDKEYILDITCEQVKTDNHTTSLYTSSFNQVKGVVGYTIKFDCPTFRSNPKVTEDDKLALMVYEVNLK